MLKRRLLLTAAGAALLAGSVSAEAVEIATSTKTPVKTSTDGDIDITSAGQVSIDLDNTAAVTIDSDNSVTNAGVISNDAKTGGIGVLIEGGHTGSFVNNGIVRTFGENGTDRAAIRVRGPGTFTGTIATASSSTLLAEGDNAIGIDIATNFTGNLDHAGGIIASGPGARGIDIAAQMIGNLAIDGGVAVFDEDAIGILIRAPLVGAFSIGGAISAQGTQATPAPKGSPQPGSAIALGASVTGGLSIKGPTVVDDTTAQASIQTVGSAPALHISPQFALAAANIVIGDVADPIAPGFGILNRGTISGFGSEAGVSANAVLIEGEGGFSSFIAGGIYNRGGIAGAAGSDITSGPADATAIRIGSGGVVPSIVNAISTSVINATTSGSEGGIATAIRVDFGGSLSTISNAGEILASAATTNTTIGTLNAYAIHDLAGTITSVTNTGTLSATATTLKGGTQMAVAADLSVSTSNITFANSGTLVGDVLFGGGNDFLSVTGSGTLTGDVTFGAGANQFVVNGAGASASGLFTTTTGALDVDLLAGAMTVTGPGGLIGTSFDAGANTLLTLGLTGDLTGDAATLPMLGVTGNASFDANSRLAISFVNFPDASNVVLIRAGTLTLPPAITAATLAAGLPLLYADSQFDTSVANELRIDLRRKTSGDLGLSAVETLIYEPAIEAARMDDAFATALLGLTSDVAVQGALSALAPNVSDATRKFAVAVTDQARGAIGARQRTLRSYARQGDDIALWAQEFVQTLNVDPNAPDAGYTGSGFGFAVGADGGAPSSGRYGFGVTYFTGDASAKAPRNDETLIEWYMLSAYTNWLGRGLFFDTQLTAGYGDFNASRDVSVGTALTRTAAADWSGYLAAGGFSTGFMLTYNSVVFMPQFSIDGLYVHEDAYDESGGGDGVNLHVEAREQNSVRAYLGFTLRNDIAFENGFIQSALRGGWSQELLDDPLVLDASFVSTTGTGTPFSIDGADPQQGELIGGASLAFAAQSWSLGLNYDVTASDGLLGHAGVLTLTGRF